MEVNDWSFSVPKWRSQEIISLTQIEEEQIYAATAYTLNDFKDNTPSLPFVFCPQQQSDLQQYSGRRTLHFSLPIQIACFYIFLTEATLSHNQAPRSRVSVLTLFKRDLPNLIVVKDLCDTGGPHAVYCKKQIIQKILIQYINKSILNASLIDILLVSNSFLRFAITLVLKNALRRHIGNNNKTGLQHPSLQLQAITQYFSTLFRLAKSQQITKDSSLQFRYISNQLISRQFLLKVAGQNIYLYRSSKTKIKVLFNQQQPQVLLTKANLKNRQTSAVKLNLQSREATTDKVISKKSAKKGKEDQKRKKGNFWSCLCWLTG